MVSEPNGVSIPAFSNPVGDQNSNVHTKSTELQTNEISSHVQENLQLKQQQHAPSGDDVPINLVLRIRNTKRELNDIRFEFTVDKGFFFTCSFLLLFFLFAILFSLTDTSDGIASELISAGLVDMKDFLPVAQNLKKLIEDRGKMKNVVFPLVCVNAN